MWGRTAGNKSCLRLTHRHVSRGRERKKEHDSDITRRNCVAAIQLGRTTTVTTTAITIHLGIYVMLLAGRRASPDPDQEAEIIHVYTLLRADHLFTYYSLRTHVSQNARGKEPPANVDIYLSAASPRGCPGWGEGGGDGKGGGKERKKQERRKGRNVAEDAAGR